jgi:hypothetical protein
MVRLPSVLFQPIADDAPPALLMRRRSAMSSIVEIAGPERGHHSTKSSPAI